MARAAAKQREPSGRVQLNIPSSSSSSSSSAAASMESHAEANDWRDSSIGVTGKRAHNTAFNVETTATLPLPPGVSSAGELATLQVLPQHVRVALAIQQPTTAQTTTTVSGISTNPLSPSPSSTGAVSSTLVLPPKPMGPPPPWAFKSTIGSAGKVVEVTTTTIASSTAAPVTTTTTTTSV